MAGHDAEIADPGIRLEFAAEQAHGVLDEDRIGRR